MWDSRPVLLSWVIKLALSEFGNAWWLIKCRHRTLGSHLIRYSTSKIVIDMTHDWISAWMYASQIANSARVIFEKKITLGDEIEDELREGKTYSSRRGFFSYFASRSAISNPARIFSWFMRSLDEPSTIGVSFEFSRSARMRPIIGFLNVASANLMTPAGGGGICS